MTLVYSSYNPYPGAPSGSSIIGSSGRVNTSTTGYNFLTGREPALLPQVNLFNSFDYELKLGVSYNSTPSTLISGIEVDQSYANTGIRSAAGSSLTPSFGMTSESEPTGLYRVYKKPVEARWVKTGGPQNNGVARNERGDWFTEEALSTADDQGTGIRLTTQSDPDSSPYYVGFSTTTSSSGSSTSTAIATSGTPWNKLRINGSYNSSVFCYNEFDYITDNNDDVIRATSLFELPERIDNIISFIPDERSTTTLEFYIEVDYVLEVYDPFGFGSSSTSSILDLYEDNGVPISGTDIHRVTHVIKNNTSNWPRVLQEIIDNRQRSLDEQDARYGNTFPTTPISPAELD